MLYNEITGYRRKTIKAGTCLEVEIYPYHTTRTGKRRAVKLQESRLEQKNLNEKNARKRFARLLNTNFTATDYHAVFTYAGDTPTQERAAQDARNLLNRWQRARKREGLPQGKYMYVIEGGNIGKSGHLTRAHIHIILEGGLSRDAVENLWTTGRANARRLQPDEFGLEGLARYLMKDPEGRKRWGASRNLKEPNITIADHAVSRRRAKKMAADEDAAREILERDYPGYAFNDVQVQHSDFSSGVYIYARMRWTGGTPKRRAGNRE